MAERARRALSSLRRLDRAAAKTVADAVRTLAANPYPEASNQLGDSRFWRLRLGQFRVTYEIDEALHAIHIYNVGPVPPAGRR
jgi:mRNA interferase RelE/StbE